MNDGRMMMERMNGRTMCGGTRYGRILLVYTIIQPIDHLYDSTTITLSNYTPPTAIRQTERTHGYEPATVEFGITAQANHRHQEVLGDRQEKGRQV
jgi:hypothetical protein